MCTMVKRDVFGGKPMVYLCVGCRCALLGYVCNSSGVLLTMKWEHKMD